MFRIKIDYLENIIEEARAANMRMLYLCVCVCVEGAAEITDCLYTRSGRVCSNLEGREKKQRGRYEMHIYKIFIIVNNSAINCVLCGAITEEELPLTLTKRRRRRWGEHGSSDNNNNNKCLMDMLLLPLLLLLGGGGRVCVCVGKHREQCKTLLLHKKQQLHTHKFDQRCDVVVSLPMLASIYMCVCVYVTAAAVTTTNTAAVRGWARVQRGGMGRGEELREAQLSGVPLRDCASYINMNIFLPFSFYKLIHKLSTATTAT